MALRAEELRGEEALLQRYIESARRRERLRVDTATNPDGTRDLLLARYLRALRRNPPPEGVNLEHAAVRTCPSCGERTEFREERGGWAECPSCGQMA
ncbi:MAG TPA: hypothetical protein VGB19_00070 [Actinomycetota bacterium]